MLASEIEIYIFFMPVMLVTMKLLNGFFRKAEATPRCITESETDRDIVIEARNEERDPQACAQPLPAFDKVHMYSGKGIGNRWNDLLELVVINLKIVHQTYRKGRKHDSIRKRNE